VFDILGLDLKGKDNICEVCDIGDGRWHQGPHSDTYHETVYDRLVNGIDWSGDEATRKSQAKQILRDLCREMNTKNSDLRNLATRPPR
jgi:hypothetical protein